MSTTIPALEWSAYQGGAAGTLIAQIALDSAQDTEFIVPIVGQYSNKQVYADGVIIYNTQSSNTGPVIIVAGTLTTDVPPFNRDFLQLGSGVGTNIDVQFTTGTIALLFYNGTPPVNPTLVNYAAAQALGFQNVMTVALSGQVNANYPVPSGTKGIKVRMTGGGAGGGGAGGSSATGGNGGDTSVNGTTAIGGKGGPGQNGSNTLAGGIGGTGGADNGASTFRVAGQNGSWNSTPGGSAVNTSPGGSSAFFGGGGPQSSGNGGTVNGMSAVARSGGAGAGAINPGGTQPAAGGGAGESCEFWINTPLPSILIVNNGVAGVAGAGTGNGGAGSEGPIVLEIYS